MHYKHRQYPHCRRVENATLHIEFKYTTTITTTTNAFNRSHKLPGISLSYNILYRKCDICSLPYGAKCTNSGCLY